MFTPVVQRSLLAATAAAMLLATALATDPPAPAEVHFEKSVLPILTAHCLECHGAEQSESNLRLDSMEAALRGGDSGEQVIVPGESHRSHLIERITSKDPALRMPPQGDRLNADQIKTLTDWIGDAPAWNTARQALENQTLTHWAFQPINDPIVPSTPTQDRVVAFSPVDAFIVDLLQQSKLEPSRPAERQELIRRLTLVMHGLPPTPEAVNQFVNDERVDAWERLVDRVLASPRTGERWASHWLDLIRFGETNGFETNRERPHAWPYRDWVVQAINEDLPYDQFVRQQLAGDQLGQPVATGFLVSGPNDIVKGQNALLGLMQRQDELADIVNTTGTSLLGLTIGCARCHNHKFDPITQVDYYAMQAVFAGVEHADRVLPTSPQQAAQLRALTAERQQCLDQLNQWSSQQLREPVQPRENTEQFAPSTVKWIRFTIEETSGGEPCIDELQIFSGDQNVALATLGAKAQSSGDFVHPLHKLEHVHDGQFGNSRSWICSQRRNGWVQIELPRPMEIERIVWGRDRHEKFTDRLPIRYRIEGSVDATEWKLLAGSMDRRPMRSNAGQDFDLAQVLPEHRAAAEQVASRLQAIDHESKSIREALKVYAGTFQSNPPAVRRLFRGDPLAPREMVEPGVVQALGSIDLPNDASEPARRLAVADWIIDRSNPLTSRVMVNRLWQYHFGQGIVDTPSDFGASGSPPTHPELLDWLASEFMDGQWSVKSMHHLILTSYTWQQTSHPDAQALTVDASSRWLWRFPPRRLEAESIRDSILCVSGQIDLTIGGAGFSAFEVELENVRHYHPKRDYGPADWRRMLYMTKVRQEKDSTFGVFDCPDASQVTPKRSRSTTPLQSLNLLNSRFVLQQAEYLANRLKQMDADTNAQIQSAFELCFNRFPTSEESLSASRFVQQHGLVQFARALLNSNEFIFIP